MLNGCHRWLLSYRTSSPYRNSEKKSLDTERAAYRITWLALLDETNVRERSVVVAIRGVAEKLDRCSSSATFSLLAIIVSRSFVVLIIIILLLLHGYSTL